MTLAQPAPLAVQDAVARLPTPTASGLIANRETHELESALGLLCEVTLHHRDFLEVTRGRAEDLELPVLGQVAGRERGHAFLFVLSPASGGGCSGTPMGS